jgi:Tripartite tricarboxylate transporter TctB family
VARSPTSGTRIVREVGQAHATVRDLGAALFFLAWAGAGWISTLTTPELFGDFLGRRDPGPALMPLMVLGVLTAGGLGLLIGPVIALFSRRAPFGPVALPNWRPPAFFVTVAAFPFLMTAIGHIATTLAFVFAWAFLLSPDAFRRPVRSAVLAAIAAGVTTLVIHVGFGIVIGAPLP